MLSPSDKGREGLNLWWLVEEGGHHHHHHPDTHTHTHTHTHTTSHAPLPFQLKEDIIMSKWHEAAWFCSTPGPPRTLLPHCVARSHPALLLATGLQKPGLGLQLKEMDARTLLIGHSIKGHGGPPLLWGPALRVSPSPSMQPHTHTHTHTHYAVPCISHLGDKQTS